MVRLNRLARLPFVSLLIGWVFAHLSFVIPIKRLRENELLIAFHHPRPSYPIHILLVPKRRLGSLMELRQEDTDFLFELFQAVQSLVTEFELEKSGFRLIVNGGRYQEIHHLHFHLLSNEGSSELPHSDELN